MENKLYLCPIRYDKKIRFITSYNVLLLNCSRAT